jgi:hypothetical protein
MACKREREREIAMAAEREEAITDEAMACKRECERKEAIAADMMTCGRELECEQARTAENDRTTGE